MPVELRPWQKEILNSIHDADENTTIAINAPTGSGKTLLSLRLADKLGADVIIAGVRTRTEQRRFWEDIHKFDIPYYPLVFFAKNEQCLIGRNEDKDLLEEIEDEKDITCEGCKYSKDPVTVTELSEKIKEKMDSENNEYNALEEIVSLANNVGHYLSKTVDVFPDDIKDYQKTLAERLGRKKICTYALTKNLAYGAVLSNVPVVLIGTYPYIFSFPSVLFKRLYKLPNSDELRFVTIIDEAHNLDNLDFLELKISEKRLERVIETVVGYCSTKTGEEMMTACKSVDVKKLEEIARRFSERLKQLAKQKDLLDKEYIGITNKRLCGKDECDVQNIVELLTILNEFAEEVVPIAAIEKETFRKRGVFPFIRAVGIMNGLFEKIRGYTINSEKVPSIIPDWLVIPDVWRFYLTVGDSVSLSIKPFSPKPIITKARSVFRGPWIIMSGTLYSKEYIERVWGLEITHYFDESEKAAVGQLVVRYVSGVTSLFTLRGEKTNQKFAKRIWEIVTSSGDGVYLIVYPNYKMMREISSKLQSLLNDQVVQFTEEQVKDTKTLLDLAQANKKLVFHAVAKGRFAEGIELTRNNESLIKHVIIVGVPLPSIGDDYIQDRISASGYDESEWLSEHGRITTLQAIGRAIRFPNDSATVWLLDSRYNDIPPYYAKKWGIKSRLRKTF